MEAPRLLYGRYQDVHRECRKVITRLKRGAAWEDAVDSEPVDTATVPGLLVLSGPSPLLGGSPHFQLFLLHFLIRGAVGAGQLSSSVESEVFRASLETPWETLALLSAANVMWVTSTERYAPVLEAAVSYWDTYKAEGPRYSIGFAAGESLWTIHTNLKYILANMGVPPALLKRALPPRGLTELLQSALQRDARLE